MRSCHGGSEARDRNRRNPSRSSIAARPASATGTEQPSRGTPASRGMPAKPGSHVSDAGAQGPPNRYSPRKRVRKASQRLREDSGFVDPTPVAASTCYGAPVAFCARRLRVGLKGCPRRQSLNTGRSRIKRSLNTGRSRMTGQSRTTG